jgi:Pyruvate/2-oxoacid:ferredoxin oxidoreductase gamma subunit
MGNNYPTIKEIEDFLKNQFNYVYIIDARELALKAGSSQSLNIVMLGVLSGLENIPINQEILESSLLEFVPTNAQDVNKKAFKFGMDKGKGIKRYLQ